MQLTGPCSEVQVRGIGVTAATSEKAQRSDSTGSVISRLAAHVDAKGLKRAAAFNADLD
jgi:hypothetical protein